MTWGDSHYGTYATTRTWLNDAAADRPGTDDTYPDADELEALLELAEDHRNESRNP